MAPEIRSHFHGADGTYLVLSGLASTQSQECLHHR
jgi:hypothetical protein